MFNADCGRYPATEEGLGALIQRPPNIPPEKWRHKYLDVDRIPDDVWGRPYVYLCPGAHNTNTFDLYSCGPLGKSNYGGDDPWAINNWNPASPLAWPVLDEEARKEKIRCVCSTAIFFLVLAMAWMNRRFRKSEGNLSGVFALLLLTATPALLELLGRLPGIKATGNCTLIALVGWVTALTVLIISGVNRGNPFSKFCARMTFIVLMFFLFFDLFFLQHWA